MPNSFRAALCTRLDGPDSLEVRSLPVAPLSAGQARIRVCAAGIGFPDLLMTRGGYQLKLAPPYVPGMSGSGEIIEINGEAGGWSIGDRVIFGGRGGSFAELASADIDQLTRLPAAFSYAEGASYNSGAITALHALVDRGQMRTGETILVLGASGGVGVAAVQLAHHLGAIIIGTGSTPEKREAISNAGAHHTLDPGSPDFIEQVKALTQGRGVDLVFDPVGGDLAGKARRTLGWGGRYLIVGFASGTIPDFPANHAMIKGYSILGLRAGESGRRDPALGERNRIKLVEFAAAGIMRPIISHVFPLESAADALKSLETRQVIGRAVITP